MIKIHESCIRATKNSNLPLSMFPECTITYMIIGVAHSLAVNYKGNNYTHPNLIRRTYPDTSVEFVEARVGMTSFGHVQNFYYNS